MSTVTSSRHIDAEGFPYPAVIRWDGIECVVTADVDQSALQAAVDAAPTALDPADTDRNRATIEAAARAHLADLRTVAGSTGTLSGQQLSNAVRLLARGQVRVIRLLLHEFDGTD